MPTYEYQCKSCKAVYDLRQGFDAATTHTCEECGKGVAKRVLSTPAVVFKGGGWYATDSRNSKSAVSDSDSSSEKSGSDTSSSESKPDKKPEAAAKTETKSTASETAAGA